MGRRRTNYDPEEAKGESLETAWPPEWMTSYSDVATLMMTFFIVLATMLALNIDPRWLRGEDFIEMEGEDPVEPIDISALSEQERNLIEQFKVLDYHQLRELERIPEVQQLAGQVQQYIVDAELEGFVRVEVDRWKVTIIPLAPFFFPPARDTLSPAAREFLDPIAEFIKLNPVEVRVSGHTDSLPISTPRFPSNWELSAARANAVLRYLVEEHGIDPKTISAVGHAHHRPVADNETEEGRRKNRRVEIEVIQRPSAGLGEGRAEGVGEAERATSRSAA